MVGRMLRRLLKVAVPSVLAIVVWTGAAAGPAHGDELLFMSNRSNNVFEYYRMQPQTRRVERVLTERGETGQMSWSPDGSQVLFLASRGAAFQSIFVTRLADARTQRLTQEDSPVAEPTWSPDGKQIAFVSSRLGPRRIFVMNADGSDQRAATRWTSVDELSPRFSPDGKRIAFLATSDPAVLPRVSVVELGTGEARQLSSNSGRGTEAPPVWSPDGRVVATSAVRGQQSQLVALATDGLGPKDLTNGDGRHTEAQWSPDGKQLLYLSIPANSAHQSLHVMNADGSGARKLHGGAHNVMNARWSADGSRVYFVEHLDEGGKIFSVDRSGRDLRRLSGDEGFDVDVQPCCHLRPTTMAGTVPSSASKP